MCRARYSNTSVGPWPNGSRPVPAWRTTLPQAKMSTADRGEFRRVRRTKVDHFGPHGRDQYIGWREVAVGHA